MRYGDCVRLAFEDRTVEAEVTLASGNGRSLVLAFDGFVDGCVGTMPVLLEDDGTWTNILSGHTVRLTPAPDRGR